MSELSRVEDLLNTGVEEPVIPMSRIEAILRGETITPMSRIEELLINDPSKGGDTIQLYLIIEGTSSYSTATAVGTIN